MAKIILSNRVEKLTGWLKHELPFILQHDNKGSVYTRRTKPYMDGFDESHWQFLCIIAQMCSQHLHIEEIEVDVNEIAEALSEKKNCHFLPIQILKWTGKKVLNSEEFLELDKALKERGM